MSITYFVPQGSILGPLLVNISLNITNIIIIKCGHYIMYAGDSSISLSEENYHKLSLKDHAPQISNALKVEWTLD